MKIINKDIFEDYDSLDFLCITTNSILNKQKHLIMGAGIAKQAATFDKDMSRFFGWFIDKSNLNGKFYGLIYYKKFIAFQTKLHWRDNSPMSVVESSIKMLDIFARCNIDKKIGLPFPAINNGGLKDEDVLPYLRTLPENVVIYKFKNGV